MVTITTSEAKGCTFLTVAGELDVDTAPGLRQAIAALISNGVRDLLIDLTKVEFLDSTGLGVLVACLKNVRGHQGSLRLVCNQERLLGVFKMTGLLGVFAIHDTVEAALAAR
jgi:anti-sigma B factor antagonist